jgi:hypothetical protein
VRAYIKSVETQVNKMTLVPRVGYRYPFDLIGLATLSKAFALSKACLRLLTGAFTDEAYGLCRSIVECATDLRYVTADRDSQEKRTRDFVNYAKAQKAFWAHCALEQFKGKKGRSKQAAEVRQYMKEHRIISDPKSARRHWSGLSGFIWDVMTMPHPLDGPVTITHRKTSYAADYFQTSAFVHCSLPAIDNYFFDEGIAYRVSPSSEGVHETCQTTLFIVLIYLHHSIAYVLFGMNIDRPAKFNELFQATLIKMKPVPRRHKSRS